jgi:hypothetical protein
MFHIWRIPAGVLFLYYAAIGGLPVVFAVIAGVGDILAGLAAATLIGREATPQRLKRIHAFGFADFVSAVGTGLTSTLIGDPLMSTLTTLPMALIPLFGVGLSGSDAGADSFRNRLDADRDTHRTSGSGGDCIHHTYRRA